MLFRRNITQWIAGPAGVIGLRYDIIWKELEELVPDKEKRDEWKAKIRLIECQALSEIHTRP